MNKLAAKLTALGLATTIAVSAFPIGASAATAGVYKALPLGTGVAGTSSIYAGKTS